MNMDDIKNAEIKTLEEVKEDDIRCRNMLESDTFNYIQPLGRSKRLVNLLLELFFDVAISVVENIVQDIEEEKRDRRIQNNFKQVFAAVGRNYDAIKENYHAIRKVEEKVDRNFVALNLVFATVTEALTLVEQIRVEMHQEFSRVLESIRNSRIEPTVSKLNIFFQFFSNEKEKIKKIPYNEHIAKLQDDHGILDQLKYARMPKSDSLHTLLYDIINQGYAIPHDAHDEVAFSALYTLHYGTQTYVSVMLFLVEQYSYLADYHYQSGHLEKYNRCIDSLLINFQDFKHSLIENINGISLIDSVINVLNTVESKDFVKNNDISKRVEALSLIKHQLEGMKLPIIEDMPVKLIGKPRFENEGTITPIGKWKDGAEVRYAIQYRDNGTYSKIGEWSNPITISGKANPIIEVPTNRKTRLIFRKFNHSPQLAGVLEDKYETRFRDINRDLYDAASGYNEDLAIKEVEVLIRNGGDVNAVFDKGRCAIHAAAQGDNVKLARDHLLNITDINVKDNGGYTPLHIAAEAGHTDFIQLLVDYGADVNARTYSEDLTPLHIVAYKGYVSAIQSLMKSNDIDINAIDKEGFTALHSAVEGGVPVVEILLSNTRTDVNAKSKEGLTPLHLSSVNNYVDIAETLLRSGKVDVNARAVGNFTALHFASMIGHLETVKFLTSRNETNVNAESINKWTPLHFAVSFKKYNIIKELLNLNSTNVNIISEGGITALHIAATTKQTSVVLSLLQKGAAADEHTIDGLTALHLAAAHGNQQGVSTLIDNNSNIEAETLKGLTPLMYACKSGHLKILKYLIDRKARLDVHDSEGNTPLHLAAKEDQLEVVQYLVSDKEVDIQAFNSRCENVFDLSEQRNNTKLLKYLINHMISRHSYSVTDLLFMAARKGYHNLLTILIEDGKIDFTAKDRLGYNILLQVCQYGHLDTIKYLVDKGVNIEAKVYSSTVLHEAVFNENSLNIIKYFVDDKNVNVNVKDKNGDTPLLRAARFSNLDVVEYLVNKGADIEATNVYNVSVLHEAVFNENSLNIIKYFVDDKNVNVNVKDKNGDTPLLHAARFSNLDVVEYLVNKRADVKAINNDLETVLHKALFNKNSLKKIKYFVDNKNVNVNVKDKNGDTPLLHAARFSNLDVVEYLVNKGADVKATNNDLGTVFHKAVFNVNSLNIFRYFVDDKNVNVDVKNKNGDTPLFYAVQFSNLDVVEYLVNKGADVKATNNNFETVLHKAASNSQVNIVKYLVVEKNAKLNVKNRYGETPLFKAVQDNNFDVVKYLLDEGADLMIENVFHRTVFDLVAFNDNYKPMYRFLKSRVGHRKRRGIEYLNAGVDGHPPSWFAAGNVVDSIKDVPRLISSQFQSTILVMNQSSPSFYPFTTHHFNVNNTLALLNIFIRNITGQKFICTNKGGISDQEAIGHAINITERFEKKIEKAALKCRISMNQLDIDFVKVQTAITRKILGCKSDEIAQVLKSHLIGIYSGRKGTQHGVQIEPKKLDMFTALLNKELAGLLGLAPPLSLHHRDNGTEVSDIQTDKLHYRDLSYHTVIDTSSPVNTTQLIRANSDL